MCENIQHFGLLKQQLSPGRSGKAASPPASQPQQPTIRRMWCTFWGLAQPHGCAEAAVLPLLPPDSPLKVLMLARLVEAPSST